MPTAKFSQLEKAILAGLCYYDVFDYPLTAEEIWRWLYVKDGKTDFPKDLNAVLEVLEMSKNLKEVMETDENYYYLKGRREIVETRKERFEADKNKWRIAKSAMGFLRMVPFLKYVAVCNNVAINNAKAESDIDFFIVASTGQLWTCRFFTTWFTWMLGYWRHKNKIRNKICLSFYAAEESLDFQPLLLKEGDPYFNFWVDQLVPLFDRGGTGEKIKAQNTWVLKQLPNALAGQKESLVKPDSLTAMIQQFFEIVFINPILGPWLTNFIRHNQMKKMGKNQESVAKENNTKVVIADSVLKFHETDKREFYRQKFYERLKTQGLE
ncbi:MAG: hypothetical protein WC528_04070 [Patescibacteria group bacterium]